MQEIVITSQSNVATQCNILISNGNHIDVVTPIGDGTCMVIYHRGK